MWTPSNGFDSGLMFAPLEGRLSVEFLPHHELVVVSSRGELLVLVIPLQATDFLLMANKLAKPLIGLPDVTMINGAIP